MPTREEPLQVGRQRAGPREIAQTDAATAAQHASELRGRLFVREGAERALTDDGVEGLIRARESLGVTRDELHAIAELGARRGDGGATIVDADDTAPKPLRQMDRRGAPPGRHVEQLEPRPQSQQRAQPLAEDDLARVEGIRGSQRSRSWPAGQACSRLPGMHPRGFSLSGTVGSGARRGQQRRTVDAR